ncbi:VPLPA-CTERM sorting domain-containing protein [Methylomonas sp. MgM2]
MMKTKLARAITLTLAGGALSLGAASNASATSTTMYNTFTTNQATDTDGWVYGGIGYNNNPNSAAQTNGLINPNASQAYKDAHPNNTVGAVQGFVGINGSSQVSYSTPFGYVGSSHLNWAAELGAVGDTATISSADSSTKYGFAAEIDTGAGAWMDNGGTIFGVTGWKHQTDIGLIKSAATQYITLKLDNLADPSLNDNFGVTIFTGMDTNTEGYAHHGAWNQNATPSTGNNPFGTQGVNYLMHDATVDAVNGITFLATAGQVYSIYLGGNSTIGTWSQNVSNYSLAISSAPVPVPAAAWLFGGALMSLVGARRRKSVLPA